MRLYHSKIAVISHECVKALVAGEDIEATHPKEVEADVASVLNTFLTAEREVNDAAKDLLERTGRGMDQYNRVRTQIAESKGIRVGDEALDYVLDQIVEIFHHSANVDEIFSEDVVLRKKMAQVIKKHTSDGDELDTEVRAQLKHVKEGSQMWDIEYQRVMERVRRNKGLS